MTAQCKEHLVYKGKDFWFDTEPLDPYLKERQISFNAPNTACWRGYIGDWLIESKKLYLVGLRAYISKHNLNNCFESEEVGLDYLFPGQHKVFASWFSGILCIPHGELLEYVRGYCPLYEKEFLIKIRQGVVVKSRDTGFIQRLKKNFVYRFISFRDKVLENDEF